MIAKTVFLYLLLVAAIGGILYGLPALKPIAEIHKMKFVFAAGLGFLLTIIISILEMSN